MKRPKVLVADDDRALRSALRTRLADWGYATVEAADGLEAIAQAVQHDVCAIVLDQEMPRGDGRSVARVIRRECSVPIVFISGHSPDEFQGIIAELKDVHFVPKTAGHEGLRDQLERITRLEPSMAGDGEICVCGRGTTCIGMCGI